MIENRLQAWPSWLTGAVSYGFGMAIGTLVTVILVLLRVGGFLVSLLPTIQLFWKLIFAAGLIFVIAGVAGGVAGAIGGYLLAIGTGAEDRRRYAWRSGWSLFIAHAVMIVPVLLVTIVFGFLNADLELEIGKLPTLFAVFGLIYGAIAGLLIGWLVAGLRQALGVILSAVGGFGVGGWFLGLALFILMNRNVNGGLLAALAILLGFLLFGAAGGAGIGFAFKYIHGERPLLPQTRVWRFLKYAALAILLLIVMSAAGKLVTTLTIRQPDLAEQLILPAVTEQWRFPEERVPATPSVAPSIVAGEDNVLLVWVQDQADAPGVFLSTRASDAWEIPIEIPSTATPQGASPAVAIDEGGRLHAVWPVESSGGASALHYSRCDNGACSPSVSLSDVVATSCAGPTTYLADSNGFEIESDGSGGVLVAWTDVNTLSYFQMAAGDTPESGIGGCLDLSNIEGEPGEFSLVSNGPASFMLAFGAGAGNEKRLYEWRNDAGKWDEGASEFGVGSGPTLFVDSAGKLHRTWCGDDNLVHHVVPDGSEEQTDFTRCTGKPLLTEAGDGRLYLLWPSDQAKTVTGGIVGGNFLYEQVLDGAERSEPAIVAEIPSNAGPALSGSLDGTLHLAWAAEEAVKYGSKEQYECLEPPATHAGQAVLAVLQQEKYRAPGEIVPYCANRFEKLLYTPNPIAPGNDDPDNPNAAFDDVAHLIKSAQYEALFATMQWDAPNPDGGPGATLANAVADLYEMVKANPEAYPRGMTVRILLGNVPDLAIFEPTTQVYHVFEDLRNAGVEEMRNDDIGWRLEIADYGGIWPHMHTKFAVVDGQTALAAGFNFGFLHLPLDHPSGKGFDMSDAGIQLSGPVAQAVMAAYDDLWNGSDLITCPTFPPPVPLLAFLWCDVSETPTDHPPEVLRLEATDDETVAFALHHTLAHLAADDAIVAAINSAQETIDVFEVNFSLDTVCVAMILISDLCNEDDLAPPYMLALRDAVLENDVRIRVMVESTAMNGFENRMGIRWLQDELDKAGKQDNLEVKFYNGKMHDKIVLVDNEFLIVGSHNFHWSAWGTPSLTEYSIATEEIEAIERFLSEFNYSWAQGIPAEEQMLPR